MLSECLFFFPSKNEQDNLINTIADLFDLFSGADVLIVDDSDSAPSLPKSLQSNQVELLHREPESRGLVSAYLLAYQKAAKEGKKFLVQLDSDGQHRIEDIPKILQELQHFEVVIGSRYCSGGSVHGWSIYRRILSRTGNQIFRQLLSSEIKDWTSGFRGFKVSALQSMWKTPPESKYFTFHAETTFRAIRSEIKIAEVPIRFCPRVYGVSNMSLKSALESLIFAIKWRMRLDE